MLRNVAVTIMLFLLFPTSSGQQDSTNLTALLENIEKSDIVPEVIPKVPEEAIDVEFPSSKVIVRMGNTISVGDAGEKPNVKFSEKPGNRYTFMMIDPDAPSRKNPKFRHWLHWLVLNAPGPDQLDGSDDNPTFKFAGPGPPKGVGPHRYLFLVFCQGDRVIDEKVEKGIVKSRSSFSLVEFRRRNALRLPFAANFFFAENK